MDPGVGATVRGTEITRLGATNYGAEPPKTFHIRAELTVGVAELSAKICGAELHGAELGALICGAERAAIYTFFLPFFPRFYHLFHPFSVFIRTSTRRNDKIDLGKFD